MNTCNNLHFKGQHDVCRPGNTVNQSLHDLACGGTMGSHTIDNSRHHERAHSLPLTSSILHLSTQHLLICCQIVAKGHPCQNLALIHSAALHLMQHSSHILMKRCIPIQREPHQHTCEAVLLLSTQQASHTSAHSSCTIVNMYARGE